MEFNAKHVSVVFGAPGTGKTTYLLSRISELLEQGVSSQDIAFITFSRGAIREVLRRLNLPRTEVPWFRTVHSCAFRLLELRRDQVFTDRELVRFNESTGYRLSRKQIGLRSEDSQKVHWSNEAAFLNSAARALNLTLAEYFSRITSLVTIRLDDAEQFAETYERYKRLHELRDFADIITDCQESFPLNVQHVFVDEAQDLTPQQWDLVQRLTTYASHITVVGDDDQTIYGFAGATARAVVLYARLHPDQVSKLEHSHRLPPQILRLSQALAQKLDVRVPKNITPRADVTGEIRFFDSFTDLALGQGDWLILARHQYQLRAVAKFLQDYGYSYWYRGTWSTHQPELRVIKAWEKWRLNGVVPSHGDKRVMAKFRALNWPPPKLYAELNWWEVYPTIAPIYGQYYRSLLRNGELEASRLRLATMHESKGTECENVALLTSYSGAVKRSLQLAEQAELHQDEMRVLYVALTRVQKNLWLQHPDQVDNYLTTLLRGIPLE